MEGMHNCSREETTEETESGNISMENENNEQRRKIPKLNFMKAFGFSVLHSNSVTIPAPSSQGLCTWTPDSSLPLEFNLEQPIKS